MAEVSTTQPSETPVLDGLLKDFFDDYKAGKLPPEIQQRMDDAVENYQGKVKDDVGNLKENAVDWVNDLKQEASNVASDYLSTHPDLQSMQDITPENMDYAGAMSSSRDLMHKIVEASDMVREFVDDFVHDTFDTAHDVLDIRATADEDGALSARLEAASVELEVAELKVDAAMDNWSAENDRAQDSIDAIADFAEDHPAEFNTQFHRHLELQNKANSVEPDPAEVGETATA